MTPYLIAHKVRGEPAFDVAIHMVCPECEGNGKIEHEGTFEAEDCSECDQLGYWWIIPTSGHRAYAWRWWPLSSLRYQSQAEVQDWDDVVQPMDEIQNGMPDHLPDHYPTRTEPKINLAEALGIGASKPKPSNFKRRI